jgi:signal transduction histidine kinase/CheY-like chemotaxis protein
MNVNVYKSELEKERRARLAATQLFEQKHQALKEAHHDLSQHSLKTAEKVVDQRDVIDRLKKEKAEALLEIEQYKELLVSRSQNSTKVDQAKSVFLTKMSHEFRTPLNGVINMAEELCENLPEGDMHSCADTIKISGERLLDFTNKLLLFADLSAAKPTLKSDEFSILEILDDCISTAKNAADKNQTAMILDICPGFPPMIGDAQRISQILNELISNAVTFTEKGTVTVGAAWRLVDGAYETLLWVQDTGRGIDVDYHDHVLGDFNQSEDGANRSRDGAGIGLSIVSKLVDAMGGNLQFSSVEGLGSRFEVTIPLLLAGDATLCPPKSEFNQAILIVSDDFLQQTSLTRIFEFLGVETDESDIVPESVEDDIGGVLVSSSLFDAFKQKHAKLPVYKLCSGGVEEQSVNTPTTFVDIIQLLETLIPKKCLKILAAEDNKTNQLVFKNMIKDLDVDLMIVSDGEEAVQAFHDFDPNIIFMDISMPKMDGLEATQQIRWFETEKGIPPTTIVAMTAHAMEGDEARIKSAGIDHYLTKPLKKAEIVKAINDHSAQSEKLKAS